MQYFKDVKEDTTAKPVLLTKDGEVIKTGVLDKGKVRKDLAVKGNKIISTANFWPIHVAMAFDERSELLQKNANQEYEAILAFDSSEQERQHRNAIKRNKQAYPKKPIDHCS